jgi:hypothetical protein
MQSGLFLLFAHGERPDVATLAGVMAAAPQVSISHAPAPEDEGGRDRRWLELLLDGMTFDLTGLSPGAPVELPALEYRFDCPDDPLDGRHSALALVPGPHLSGGEASLPVVRTQAGLGAILARALNGVVAVGWAPARSLIGREFFCSTVEAWLAGGPFPALGLTAFRPTLDEGLQSVGLAYLTGQEVRLEPALAADRAAATRLAVRLVNLLVSTGPLTTPDRITGPDGGILSLAPSPNGKFVRVFPG